MNTCMLLSRENRYSRTISQEHTIIKIYSAMSGKKDKHIEKNEVSSYKNCTLPKYRHIV